MNKDNNVEFKTLLENVKIHKNKLGNRKVCKIQAPYKKVGNEHQDNMNEMLGIKSEVEKDEIDISWGLERVKNAYKNKNGLVYKIIQQFIKNDFKALSKAELDKYCETDLKTTNYTLWNKTHNFYKILIPFSNLYNLNVDIIKYLNLL